MDTVQVDYFLSHNVVCLGIAYLMLAEFDQATPINLALG